MGNYTPALKSLVERLSCQFIAPDQTNQETIEQGVKIAPETICFPCKVNLGNYLSALKKGAEAILMFDSQGQCRFRYYGLLQKKILRDYGYKVSFVVFSGKNIFSQLKSMGQASFWQVVQALWMTWKKIRLVEEIEDLGRFYRPREIEKGRVDNLVKECLEKVGKIEKFGYLNKYKEIIKQKFNKLKIDNQRKVLKVGIVGEIFTITDGFSNQNIEANLGKMGIEAHRGLVISSFIKRHLGPFYKWKLKKQTKDYLTSMVGGHGMDSVAEMLDYAKKGFDGVIHLFPMGCMPEVTVRPILNRISHEKNIPLLSLSLDEQSGQAGLQTRIEAFVDLIRANKPQ